jgi:hypothetical protein
MINIMRQSIKFLPWHIISLLVKFFITREKCITWKNNCISQFFSIFILLSYKITKKPYFSKPKFYLLLPMRRFFSINFFMFAI